MTIFLSSPSLPYLPASQLPSLPASLLPSLPASQPPSLKASKPFKIRVVHLVHSFATGGMENGICTTINHGSKDFEHIIVCLTRSGEMERQLPPGTPVLALNKPPGNSIRFLRQLSVVLKKLQPAVIHTRNWSGMDGIIAARLAGIRRIVHGEHGWGVNDPYGHNVKRRWIRRILDLGVCRYTCVSRQMQDWLENYIQVRHPVTQVYNGIDTMKFRPADDGEKRRLRQELSLADDCPVIGIVARLDPIKNHRCLFEAFQQVKETLPELQLLVVGDGPERKALEAVSGEGVRFLGNRGDVADIYRTLDLFVLPSDNEGISNTVLEAMATGLPVIAGQTGGNPELIDDGVSGTLFATGNTAELEDAISAYLNSRKMARDHGIKARGLVERRFSVSEMTAAYESVWRSIWLQQSV